MRLLLRLTSLIQLLAVLLVLGGCVESTVETTDGQAVSGGGAGGAGGGAGGGGGASGAPQFSYPNQAYALNQFFLLIPTVTYSGSGLSFSITPSMLLPAGLTFDTSSGIIYGLPTATSSTTSFNVTGTNSVSTSNVSVTIVSAPIFSYPANTNYQVGSALNLTPTETFPVGGISYAITGALPAGLTFDPTDGKISGTPSAFLGAQNANFTVTGTANGYSSSVNFTLTDISPPQFAYSPSYTYSKGTPIGSSITPSVTHGNILSFNMTAGTLPTGVTLTASSGAISGTPSNHVNTNGAPHQITVQATSVQGITSSVTFDLEDISPPEVTYSTTSLHYYRNDSEGVRISGAPTTTGGITPTISFCKDCNFAAMGTLPTGFTVEPSSGKISSVAITAQLSSPGDNFSITVADSEFQAAVFGPFTIEERCNDSGSPLELPGQNFGGGGGTSSDPWMLCHKDHLPIISTNLHFLDHSSANNFILMSDIELNSTPFKPIGISGGNSGGNNVGCFKGSFDGNNKIIHNMKIHDGNVLPATYPNRGPYGSRGGFFACLEDFDFIKDLTFMNASIYVKNQWAGVLAGEAINNEAATGTPNRTISNVSTYRSFVLGGAGNTSTVVAGLVGMVMCNLTTPTPAHVDLMQIKNSIVHGQIIAFTGTGTGEAHAAGVFNTMDILTSSCVSAKDNVVFLKSLDGDDSISATSGGAATARMGYETNDQGAATPNSAVKDTIVVDLDDPGITYLPANFKGSGTSKYELPGDELDLNIPGTWISFTAQDYLIVPTLEPTSSIGWIAPKHLCERDQSNPSFGVLYDPDPIPYASTDLVWNSHKAGLRCP